MATGFIGGIDMPPVTGTRKLLVLIFVVDCSMTMKGQRIQSVNAAFGEIQSALKELAEQEQLDLKVAVMSFASNVKWDQELAGIDEVVLDNLVSVRAGLTQYGAAFHELNKVMTSEKYLAHKGKEAAPAVVFMTDGEPTDNYEYDLEQLLKNPWFAQAQRSAILMGDAIDSEKARKAVSRFVSVPEKNIVGADDSSQIMREIETATMHTVMGGPAGGNGEEDFPGTGSKPSGTSKPQGAHEPAPVPPLPDQASPFPDAVPPFPDAVPSFPDQAPPFPDLDVTGTVPDFGTDPAGLF